MYRNKQKGFSLIELMIVILIIAVLAAFAIPNYNEYTRRTRRAECQSELLVAAGKLERQYSMTSQYPLNNAAAQTIINLNTCPQGVTGTPFYNVTYTIVGGDRQTFLLTAAPAGVQTSDTKCGTLTLNHLGQKTASGSPSDSSACWR